MVWLVAFCLCLGLVAILVTIFVGAVRNARALRQDIDKRFGDVQSRLEQQANALTDELFAQTKDTTD